MAGHSKFKNIMHRKKAVDAKRSRAFSKHGRLIMNAARTGGGDLAMNLSLRYAIDRARSDNMPKDAIERAVAKGTGEGNDTPMEEVTYEGYGPGGVAMIVETLTDNRNRTVGEVRFALERSGGNLGENGCVSWNFERKAVFFVPAEPGKEEDVLMVAMEAEADDCTATEGGFEVSADPTLFAKVSDALIEAGFAPEKSEITPLPKTTVTLEDAEQVKKLVRLIDLLEDIDDVQSTATNIEWTDEALAALDED